MDYEERMYKERELTALESIAKSLEKIAENKEIRDRYVEMSEERKLEIYRNALDAFQKYDCSDIEDGGGSYE